MLALSFLVDKSGFAFQIGTPNLAPDVFGGNEFIYGVRPNPDGIDGEGVVNYSIRPVPEHSAMFGLVVVSLSLLLKQAKSS